MKSVLKPEKHIIYLNELLHETAYEFGWTKDDKQFLEMIKSVFIALRNRLSFQSSLSFVDVLPLPFKALYLNNWIISKQTPDPLQNMDDLVDEIIKCNPKIISTFNGDRVFIKHLVDALFRVISYHISRADLEKELSFLPEDVKFYLEKHHVEEY